MNRPPEYPDVIEPGEPRWRSWWLGLALPWGVQSAVLLMLWPQEQPRLVCCLTNKAPHTCETIASRARCTLFKMSSPLAFQT
jgi:hypothetical protein